MHDSSYGLNFLDKAISYARRGLALDIGCGCNTRFSRELLAANFIVDAIDSAKGMIELAQRENLDVQYFIGDFLEYAFAHKYDLIIAWDSIFHLPSKKQNLFLSKATALLNPNGVILYTAGEFPTDITSIWHDLPFSYGSIGIQGNLRELEKNDLTCKHLELDQYPHNHVVIIASKEEKI